VKENKTIPVVWLTYPELPGYRYPAFRSGGNLTRGRDFFYKTKGFFNDGMADI